MNKKEKNLPKHIAIIMDGNGRWAQKRKQPRTFGHKKGADVVRDIITEARKIGIKVLTLYTFSSENWGRDPKEVYFLMNLLEKFLLSELELMRENDIRFIVSGDLTKLPASTYKKVQNTIKDTGTHKSMVLNLALSYGARQEILQAVKKIAEDYKTDRLSKRQMNKLGQDEFSNYLYTAGLPDPDLMIRTGGDIRISNFLLWQMAYTEMYFTEKMWPEFSIADLHDAINTFTSVERRFGREGKSKTQNKIEKGALSC